MCVFVCSSHDFFCFAASSALALTLLCCLRAVTICVWFPLPKVGERDERVSELQSRLDEVEAELLAARKESTLKLSEAEAKLAGAQKAEADARSREAEAIAHSKKQQESVAMEKTKSAFMAQECLCVVEVRNRRRRSEGVKQ